ncbi:exosome complex component CSL4-like [Saccoglossus kowalevskii]|uniref:Exosome complex component CSL4-like n=1 Tax=Saccoglossus kowalevskii TaxID=10224 RepID=A0ABM0GNM3_SACKO|nr:PREDICTED: exosome complex component CSL4-like [Saccoglossus kowalevskii]
MLFLDWECNCDIIQFILLLGDRLGRCEHYASGNGTYVRQQCIYSSLAGFVHEQENDDKLPILNVTREEQHTVIPEVGSIVTAKVTNINPRFCKCTILCVEDSPLKDKFRGMIRKDDVRATEKDRIEMYKCFRPGDIILAKVLSLGDAQSYLLTTAENEFGVVLAESEAGVNMVPISWCEMQCPKTNIIEFRKVAKVQPQHILTS